MLTSAQGAGGDGLPRVPPYRYWPVVGRPRLEWPEGRGLAVYLGINVEHFAAGIPSTAISPAHASLAVDPLNHGWRDYGTRVGIWRIIELLDRYHLPATCLLNLDAAEHYPEIVAAGNRLGWAWCAHGVTNSELWKEMTLDEERSAIGDLTGRFVRATGRRPAGWLGPALTETANTPAVLSEHGFTYVLDWCNDDQPYPLDVKPGRMISVPYSIEVNDIPLFLGAGITPADFAQIVIDQFDVLHDEARRRPGAVMAIGIHPFLVGQPYRFKYLEHALTHIVGHDDIWFTNSDEIAQWYLEHYFDGALGALASRTKISQEER